MSNDLEDNYKKTLENISNLQTAEKDLYVRLERLSSTNTKDVVAQNDIVKKINDLSATRIELFKSLAFNYRSVKQSTTNSKYDVIDQITVLKMVEDQLNKSKQYINSIETSNMNQMRMVEINSYYSKRYSHHTSLIKILIIVSVLVLMVILLKKYDIISQDVSNIIISIILFISLVVFVVKGYDLMKRNDMNYDEYDVLSKPKSIEDSSSGKTGKTGMNNSINMSLGCVNGNCCSSAMIYDSDKNKCINMPPEAFTTLGDAAMELKNEMGCAKCSDKRGDNNNNKRGGDEDTYTPLQSVETTVIPFSHFSHYSSSI
jgi:hypothetical protein